MGDPRRKCELSKEIIVCLVVRKIISLTVYCTTLRTAFVTCLAATVHDSYEYLLPAEQTVGIHLDIIEKVLGKLDAEAQSLQLQNSLVRYGHLF